ncbi:MAG: ElyC/SanA/YdcF family protein [Limisphaerales bacterium]
MSSTVSSQYWGLLRRRTCWLPTLRGWLLLFVLLGFPAVFGFRNADTFLTINDPVPDGVLVVEGWSPDYAMETAMSEVKRNPYHKLYVVGGPLEQGAPLSEYKTYAELGAATLLRMGMSQDTVQAVPAPYERRDRTYAAAIALRNWFREHGDAPKTINLISVGAHARRSRLLFEKAFGNGTRVGVMDMEDRGYDPRHWWRSSQGVRSVLDEMIAYGYARFLFSPSAEASP